MYSRGYAVRELDYDQTAQTFGFSHIVAVVKKKKQYIIFIIVIIRSFKPSFRITEKYSPRIAAVFSTIGIVKTYKLVCLELINKVFTN